VAGPLDGHVFEVERWLREIPDCYRRLTPHRSRVVSLAPCFLQVNQMSQRKAPCFL
jgi:hypothetical protein